LPTENLTAITTSWTHVWLKPESTLLADGKPSASENPFPLAARVQRGLGQSAALALSADTSSAYQSLYARLLHEIAAPEGDRRFQVAAQRDAGDWLITADGSTDREFLNNQSLFLRPISTDALPDIPLLQTAPGHYQARLPGTGPLTAVVIRKTPTTEDLIARLQTPDVQSAEFPASVDRPFSPKNETILPANLDNPALWQPTSARQFSLTSPLWLLATATALAALFLRK
jgi:hypothetical protein